MVVRGSASSRALRACVAMFCLLAPASALEYRARHPDDRTPEWTTDGCTNVDFLQAVVARNLEPWLAARDRFSESYVRSRIDETLMRNEAELKKARGSQEPTGLDGLSETNSQIVSFLVHKGALYLHAPLRQTNRESRFINCVDDIRAIAEKYPDLSTEGFISFDEEGRNNDLLYFPPTWTFQRHRDRYDFPAPHYYTRPDALCGPNASGTSAEAQRAPENAKRMAEIEEVTLKPWAERDRRAFSRYAQFCRSAHVALRETANASLGEYMECPRKHLAEVSLQHGAVNGATLDVFPATGDKGDPLVRPPASFLQFGKSRYIVVSDGWSAPSGFANALALGSVVMKQRTLWEQWFDVATVPFVHYVPLFDYTADDILGKVAWLEANPQIAERIARAGREFSCRNLVSESRSCYYRQTFHHYNQFLLGYDVDDALLARRKLQYPLMFRVTEKEIVCDRMNLMGTGCAYRGPEYNSSQVVFGDGGPVILPPGAEKQQREQQQQQQQAGGAQQQRRQAREEEAGSQRQPSDGEGREQGIKWWVDDGAAGVRGAEGGSAAAAAAAAGETTGRLGNGEDSLDGRSEAEDARR